MWLVSYVLGLFTYVAITSQSFFTPSQREVKVEVGK